MIKFQGNMSNGSCAGTCGQTDRQTDRRREMTELIGFFQDYVNVRKVTVAGKVLGAYVLTPQFIKFLSLQQTC